jgi:hypothetical protein
MADKRMFSELPVSRTKQYSLPIGSCQIGHLAGPAEQVGPDREVLPDRHNLDVDSVRNLSPVLVARLCRQPIALSKRKAEAIPKAEPCLGRYRTKPPGTLAKCLIRRHHSKWQRIKHGIDLPLRHAGMNEMGHHLGVIHAAYAGARDPSGDLGGPLLALDRGNEGRCIEHRSHSPLSSR